MNVSKRFINTAFRVANTSYLQRTNRNFQNFQILKSCTFCSQTKDKRINAEQLQRENSQNTQLDNNDKDEDVDEDEDGEEELDLDALKNEMLKDFETEKTNLQSTAVDDEAEESEEEDEFEADEDEMDDDKEEYSSFAVNQFKKRIEFNEMLKSASRVKAVKAVTYSSSTLSSGIPELLYDAEGHEKWVTYLRSYTYTPFIMGCIFVPIAIYNYTEWELFPKLLLGAFYLSTSAIFPYMAFRPVKDKVNRAWLTPDCNKVVIEKLNFFFQPYKKEYLIKDLKMLYRRGSDRMCWFQCTRTKDTFMLISELMQHSVWLQLIGADEAQIADATLRNIATDGKSTMFRGPVP